MLKSIIRRPSNVTFASSSRYCLLKKHQTPIIDFLYLSILRLATFITPVEDLANLLCHMKENVYYFRCWIPK